MEKLNLQLYFKIHINSIIRGMILMFLCIDKLLCIEFISNFIGSCINKYIISIIRSQYECSGLLVRPLFNSLIYSDVDINFSRFPAICM